MTAFLHTHKLVDVFFESDKIQLHTKINLNHNVDLHFVLEETTLVCGGDPEWNSGSVDHHIVIIVVIIIHIINKSWQPKCNAAVSEILAVDWPKTQKTCSVIDWLKTSILNQVHPIKIHPAFIIYNTQLTDTCSPYKNQHTHKNIKTKNKRNSQH